MKILVVAATELEIAPLRAALPDTEILITGAGIPSVVYSITKRLAAGNVDFAIQAGICGAFAPDLQLQTLVVEGDSFADLGVQEGAGFRDLFDMGLADPNASPFTNGMLKNPRVAGFGLPEANAITVSAIREDRGLNSFFREKFFAALESMEGAGFHYVCLTEMIPFLQVRTVSNQIGERDKSKWQIKEAVNALCSHVARIIKQLDEQTNN